MRPTGDPEMDHHIARSMVRESAGIGARVAPTPSTGPNPPVPADIVEPGQNLRIAYANLVRAVEELLEAEADARSRGVNLGLYRLSVVSAIERVRSAQL